MEHEFRGILKLPEEKRMGPAMRALNLNQRLFVVALLEFGDNNYTRACMAAYPKQAVETARGYGCELAHSPKVIAAIHEEAQKRMDSAAIMVASRAVEIANNPNHRAQMKAIEFVANRTGMLAATEHRLTVEHKMGDRELEQRAIELCRELGIDATKMLGNRTVTKALAPPTIDADFTEVPADDLADLLG